jgi:hypothetical protein
MTEPPCLALLFEAQARIAINGPLPGGSIHENLHTNENLRTRDIEALRSTSRTSRHTKSRRISVRSSSPSFSCTTPARAQEAGRFLQRRKPDVFKTGQHIK